MTTLTKEQLIEELKDIKNSDMLEFVDETKEVKALTWNGESFFDQISRRIFLLESVYGITREELNQIFKFENLRRFLPAEARGRKLVLGY
jgi:hypothetical protein